jgi:hypothetical protein
MAVGCRGLGLGGTFCTSRADANDIDGPRSLFIATSMPDGASNSGLSLAPLGRQATMPDIYFDWVLARNLRHQQHDGVT